MAGSVNKVILVGNLGKDPEIRRTKDGKAIANLSVATTESWKDKTTGERRDKTEWHRVAVFNEQLASVAERFLNKGSKVYLEGQLQTRKWQDESGADRYATEVVLQGFNAVLVLLDPRERQERGVDVTPQAGRAPDRASPPAQRQPEMNFDRGFDDEIPF